MGAAISGATRPAWRCTAAHLASTEATSEALSASPGGRLQGRQRLAVDLPPPVLRTLRVARQTRGRTHRRHPPPGRTQRVRVPPLTRKGAVMAAVTLVLLIAALVAFLLATFGTALPRINFLGLGLALVTLTLILQGLPL